MLSVVCTFEGPKIQLLLHQQVNTQGLHLYFACLPPSALSSNVQLHKHPAVRCQFKTPTEAPKATTPSLQHPPSLPVSAHVIMRVLSQRRAPPSTGAAAQKPCCPSFAPSKAPRFNCYSINKSRLKASTCYALACPQQRSLPTFSCTSIPLCAAGTRPRLMLPRPPHLHCCTRLPSLHRPTPSTRPVPTTCLAIDSSQSPEAPAARRLHLRRPQDSRSTPSTSQDQGLHLLCACLPPTAFSSNVQLHKHPAVCCQYKTRLKLPRPPHLHCCTRLPSLHRPTSSCASCPHDAPHH